MFNIYMGLYIIAAIFIIGGGSYTLQQTGKPIVAGVFAIASLILFIVFGIKWFSPDSLFSKTPVPWPPMINTCPDYLVYYKRNVNGAPQDTCIDTIGVSKNGNLEVFPKNRPPSDRNFFSLETKSSDPAAKMVELCQRCIEFGLTWEGISNGESCVTPNGPIAPSGNVNNICPP